MAKFVKKKETWFQKQVSKIKGYYKKTLHTPHPINDIALAVAIGVFVSFQPTFFLFFPIIFALMFIVPVLRRNKIPFLLGSFLNNTFTSIFTFPVAYEIGKSILGKGAAATPTQLTTITKFGTVYAQLILGCIILGLVAAAITYFIIFYTIREYRKRKERKKNEKSH